jgi:F-type H+-transporting ATPase subunit b
MLIDWFTVGAQVVNFLVLVWLLKRFLYKPILDAIDSREKRIAGQIADAESKKSEAQKEQDDFSNKNKVFDEQRAALFSKAEGDAKTEHDGLLDAARKDAEVLRTAQATALRDDQARLSTEITRSTAEEVIRIARKTLADLATVSLEERVEEVFTRRLRAMQGDSKRLMGDALKSSSEAGVVRSAFDLTDAQKFTIHQALNETFSAEIHVDFEVSKALMCGMELTGNGQKLDWNIAAYLSSLDRSLAALLDSEMKSEMASAPKPGTDPKPQQDTTAVVHAGAN